MLTLSPHSIYHIAVVTYNLVFSDQHPAMSVLWIIVTCDTKYVWEAEFLKEPGVFVEMRTTHTCDWNHHYDVCTQDLPKILQNQRIMSKTFQFWIVRGICSFPKSLRNHILHEIMLPTICVDNFWAWRFRHTTNMILFESSMCDCTEWFFNPSKDEYSINYMTFTFDCV